MQNAVRTSISATITHLKEQLSSVKHHIYNLAIVTYALTLYGYNDPDVDEAVALLEESVVIRG